MASVKRTVLGIEIGAGEIRMVEMRGGSPPQILKVGSVPLPPSAMDGDRIVQIDVVADLIRGLYTKLGCQSKGAVVGLGVQSVVTRVLDIPRVPDSELRVVLEGELAHYQILRTGSGAFDYFRLSSPSPGEDVLPSVLLMATEDRVAQGYRRAVEGAGLQLIALEPITLSLYRAAYPILQNEPAALCLAVTPQRSELSILDHAQIRLYRRLELGINDLLRGRRIGAGSGVRGGPVDLSGGGTGDLGGTGRLRGGTGSLGGPRIQLNLDEDDAEDTGTDELELVDAPRSRTGPMPPLSDLETGSKVIPQVAAALANEVQRSLDYYQREFPNAPAISRVILSTNDPEGEVLAQSLSQSLRMDVRVAEPPTDAGLPRQMAYQMEAPQGLTFLGAVGLAYHALMPEWKQVPRFNLAVGGGGGAASTSIERDRLTQVMIGAVGILAGGLIFGVIVGRDAARESEILRTQRDKLTLKEKDYQKLVTKQQDEAVLETIVKSDNLPVSQVLNLVTREMPPDVGLTSFNFQRNGQIAIEGNARDMTVFTLYYFKLVECRNLVGTHYTSLTTDKQTRITTFRVETSLRGTQGEKTATGGAL